MREHQKLGRLMALVYLLDLTMLITFGCIQVAGAQTQMSGQVAHEVWKEVPPPRLDCQECAVYVNPQWVCVSKAELKEMEKTSKRGSLCKTK